MPHRLTCSSALSALQLLSQVESEQAAYQLVLRPVHYRVHFRQQTWKMTNITLRTVLNTVNQIT
jgi:hypothetical protein